MGLQLLRIWGLLRVLGVLLDCSLRRTSTLAIKLYSGKGGEKGHILDVLYIFGCVCNELEHLEDFDRDIDS